jgi:predicted nucleic acid-binding protein
VEDKLEVSESSKLATFLRSDLLPHLVELIQAFPALKQLFPQILQLRVVIDANIVQGELRWRLRRREKPSSRTALHEVLVSGVLIAYAPHFLEDEIREHVPRLAVETKSTLADVHREWEEFRKLLCFYTARTSAKTDVSRLDPDDTAYIDTMEEIAARAIYTRDRDFLQTSTPIVLVSIDTTLQSYARASAIRIGVVMGSSVSIAFGFEALLALGRLIGKLVQAAKRLPPAVQILILATIAAVIAHPKSRAKLSTLWDSLNKNLTPAMFEGIVECMYQFAEATSTAQEAYQSVEELLPPNRRRPLLSHARSVCLATKKPLALDELVQRIIAGGYVPRSKRPHSYLVRKLRSDDEFSETDTGCWIIRPVVAAV